MLENSNNRLPSVSILMAVFNRDFSLVKRALDSVLNQDFKDFEIIIIDDGSDIILGKRLLEYSFENENEIIYIRHRNVGQGQSISIGLNNCRGSFIGFIDSDDEYKSNHITACLKEINKGFDLISSITETVATKEEDYWIPDKHNLNENIYVDDCIVFGTLFGKRDVFLNIGFNNIYSLDSDFYERASRLYSTKKLNLKTYIYYLGSKDGVITKKKKERN